MSKITKQLMFGAFGISCRVSFFIISVVTAYFYSKIVCLILLGIFVLHNVVSLWYMKGKKVKVTME